MMEYLFGMSMAAWFFWFLLKLQKAMKNKTKKTSDRISKNACDIYDLQESIRNLTEVKHD